MFFSKQISNQQPPFSPDLEFSACLSVALALANLDLDVSGNVCGCVCMICVTLALQRVQPGYDLYHDS